MMNGTTTQDKKLSRSHYDLKAGDAVWIATALLHRNNPNAQYFSTEEIFDEVRRRGLTTTADATVLTHIRQHCVANRPPNPSKLRMLRAWGRGNRSLYRPGDPTSPGRDGPMRPDWESLPSEYADLGDWYENEWNAAVGNSWEDTDPLLSLIGRGKQIWADQNADDYVRGLREGW
jgi:hypothetical protein